MPTPPTGTVVGSIQLRRVHPSGEIEVYNISRHVVGSRSSFWEQSFKIAKAMPKGDLKSTQTQDSVTDPFWTGVDGDGAEEWFKSKVNQKLRSGFVITVTSGDPGPLPANVKVSR